MRSTPARFPIHLRDTDAFPVRTSGVHLSGILRAVAQRTNILKPDKEDLDSISSTIDPYLVGSHGGLMRWVIGYCWEDWMGSRVSGMTYHPGEIVLDGVIMTPDGIELSYLDGAYVLHEFKATFKSSKKHVTETAMWMWQGMGYLAGMSAKYQEACTRAVYHVLHLRGDYSGIDPMYVATEVEFEEEEIRTAWGMIQQNKHLAKAEEHDGI